MIFLIKFSIFALGPYVNSNGPGLRVSTSSFNLPTLPTLPYVHTTLCPQRPSHKVVTWLPLRMHSRVMATLLTAQVIPSFRRELLASAFATFATEDVVTVFHSGVVERV